MNKQVKVLLVEDLPSDALLVLREIKKNNIEIQSHTVDSLDEYVSALHEFQPDIILSDYNLPTFNGMKALSLRKEIAPHTPFILVTGTNNEETAVECMKAGADDYIIKENLKRLGQAFMAALEKKALAQSNRNALEKLSILSRAVEQNPALIVITNREGKIEYVNPRFTEITGYSLNEIIGRTSRILRKDNHNRELSQSVWETLLAGKEWKGEFYNKKKNGEHYWENAHISPLLNDAGEITHFVGIIEDITEKRQMLHDMIIAKEKAEAADKLKSAFINNISHEVRTPLNGILGFSEMLINADYSADHKTAFLDIIKKSSTRLLNTINGYMDISMLVSGNVEVHNSRFFMNTMLEELRDEFLEACTEKNIELIIQKPLSASDFELNADKELLHKIWFQLLGNAVKYTTSGSVSFGYRREKEGIAFFISDTGIGIDQDETRYIFDYFRQGDDSQTRAFDGSGLGLSIARELVKLLKGTITVESVKNVGSTFTFTLPVDETQAEKNKPAIRIGQHGWKSKPVILVAEDDDFNFKYLDIILKKAGYYVLRAVNGLEAVELCHSNEEINLVLMDMKMPVMGGLEATSRIKSFLPDMPIVAVTAYVSSNDENEAYLAGCCHFLSKPVNKTKLFEVIENILGENALMPIVPGEAISC